MGHGTKRDKATTLTSSLLTTLIETLLASTTSPLTKLDLDVPAPTSGLIYLKRTVPPTTEIEPEKSQDEEKRKKLKKKKKPEEEEEDKQEEEEEEEPMEEGEIREKGEKEKGAAAAAAAARGEAISKEWTRSLTAKNTALALLGEKPASLMSPQEVSEFIKLFETTAAAAAAAAAGGTTAQPPLVRRGVTTVALSPSREDSMPQTPLRCSSVYSPVSSVTDPGMFESVVVEKCLKQLEPLVMGPTFEHKISDMLEERLFPSLMAALQEDIFRRLRHLLYTRLAYTLEEELFQRLEVG